MSAIVQADGTFKRDGVGKQSAACLIVQMQAQAVFQLSRRWFWRFMEGGRGV